MRYASFPFAIRRRELRIFVFMLILFDICLPSLCELYRLHDIHSYPLNMVHIWQLWLKATLSRTQRNNDELYVHK